MIIAKPKSIEKRVKITLIATSIIVLVTSVGTYIYVKNLPPIPRSITAQLDFKPMVVAGSQKTITKPADISVDTNSKILRYSQQFKGVKLLISQQTAPEAYIDFPEKLKTAAEQIGLERTIESDKGQIFITKKDGRQTAVSIRDKVLVLVESQQLFNNDDWIEFFKAFLAV